MSKLSALDILGSISVIPKNDINIHKPMYILKHGDKTPFEITSLNPGGYQLKKDTWYMVIQENNTYHFVDMSEKFDAPAGLAECACAIPGI